MAELEGRYTGLRTVKSSKRVEFIDALVDIFTKEKIYKKLPASFNEDAFAMLMQHILEKGLEDYLKREYPNSDKDWREKQVIKAQTWEKDVAVTLHQTKLFGVQHRPDMYVTNKDYRVAIEYKLVQNGESIRAALGQGLVYASDYEFTVCVLVDITKDHRIKRAYDEGSLEKILLEKLWSEFGIRILVVAPIR